jgi:hypothetical protein
MNIPQLNDADEREQREIVVTHHYSFFSNHPPPCSRRREKESESEKRLRFGREGKRETPARKRGAGKRDGRRVQS